LLLIQSSSYLFLSSYRHHPALPSFPTRRSSDLYHGLAFNVAMDLQPFDLINPCGYPGLTTVDLSTIGVSTAWNVAADRLGHKLEDRKSTRLNSSHSQISYAVFCLKKKK